MKKRNIGIFIFNNAEVLDFAGPFEVFSVTSELNNFEPFNVFTVAESTLAIEAVNGLSVNPTYSFNTCPKIDVLIIAGGFGVRALLNNHTVLNWIKTTHAHTELTLSICSGSMLLGKIGLLDNKPFCTHHEVYNDMAVIAPLAQPKKALRYTNSQKIYTSGGISAGIDLSFHVVEQLLGKAKVLKTATYMEYNRVEAK